MNGIDYETQHLPECIVLMRLVEVPVRYRVTRDGQAIVKAAKINGHWIDPAGQFTQSLLDLWESECMENERAYSDAAREGYYDCAEARDREFA